MTPNSEFISDRSSDPHHHAPGQLAASVLRLDDSGSQSQAVAVSVCIMAVVVMASVLVHLVLRLFGSRETEILC